MHFSHFCPPWPPQGESLGGIGGFGGSAKPKNHIIILRPFLALECIVLGHDNLLHYDFGVLGVKCVFLGGGDVLFRGWRYAILGVEMCQIWGVEMC